MRAIIPAAVAAAGRHVGGPVRAQAMAPDSGTLASPSSDCAPGGGDALRLAVLVELQSQPSRRGLPSFRALDCWHCEDPAAVMVVICGLSNDR